MEHTEALLIKSVFYNKFLSIKNVSLLLHVILFFLPLEKTNNRNLLRTENCPSKIIHQSQHGDLIWFCQSFCFAVISLCLSWVFSYQYSHHIMFRLRSITRRTYRKKCYVFARNSPLNSQHKAGKRTRGFNIRREYSIFYIKWPQHGLVIVIPTPHLVFVLSYW